MFAKYPAIRHLRWASAASVLMLGACGGDSMPNSATPASSSSSPPMMPASGGNPHHPPPPPPPPPPQPAAIDGHF
jgi:hypothetical protein